MITGKVWGSTETLLKTPLIEIHRLKIKPNAYCSMHKHNFKHNAFYVISGTLYIETQKNNYNLTDVTEILPGQIHNVIPGEYHCFRTKLQDVEALEIYFPETLSEDIVRETVGGITKK